MVPEGLAPSRHAGHCIIEAYMAKEEEAGNSRHKSVEIGHDLVVELKEERVPATPDPDVHTNSAVRGF